ASAQVGGVDLDTVQAGRFDYGKMWTFEYPPAEYFSETYGFDANPAWFDRARLSVLRIPGCSASFVSPRGLVATNHHCVRGAVDRVSGPAETLLDSGFVAANLEDERPIPDYYADQLLAVEDVSDRVFEATDGAADAAERERLLEARLAELEAELRGAYADAAEGDSLWVQMIPLYNGGRWSAYVFRRFTDVRLVVAAELQMGFFGGDPDNFTYPRYALDFAFLRVYGRDGEPYAPSHWFGWSQEGPQEGDAVFIIGNPGSTNRLKSIAQLEYQRDVAVPALVNWLETRHAILGELRAAAPPQVSVQLRNAMFGLSNSLKASTGRLTALNDPVILARKADAERQLREAVAADPELAARYGDVFERLAAIQAERRAVGREHAAFLQMDNRGFSSALQRRARLALGWLEARDAGQPDDSLALLRTEIERVTDQPPPLEAMLLTERLRDFRRFLGADHEIVRTVLAGRTAEQAAADLLAGSVLASSDELLAALDAGTLDPADPGLEFARAVRPAYRAYLEVVNRLGPEESRLESDLGRARFAVFGRDVPPDGTFSPRIADGVVRGYEYNGTLAPPHTTFYGLYDRYVSHGRGEGIGAEWDLPLRWRTPPAGLDLGTPLNFVSTTDSYGGNSGSPAVTPELELVGLNFDRNIDGLSRDFIYLPERGRNVMVDVRAIREALEKVYEADRVLAELEGATTP
ncbi:MAG: S46 family peptidase, partial [Gemmatimonadota bacterium]|nr:S46 family peptidase [Gemmatimonadota bacterium]